VLELAERGVRWFDDFQQDRWWLAHPIGVVRKYADDRGSALAGLVTFQVFLGLLPLLVVVLTVFGRILEGSEDLRAAVLESALGQFPLLGARLEEDVGALSVDGPWVAASIAGLLWTSTGIYNGLQLALNQVWNVRGIDRQGFLSRLVRALTLFVLVIGAAIGTSLLRGADPLGADRLGWWQHHLSALAGALIAATLLLGVFRLVVSPEVPFVRLVPAALLAGFAWELLQRLGTWIVATRLAEAQDLYGGLGFVVVVLLWVNLLARSAVFANEWAVVSWEGLWPRRIAQPPLTEADRQVLEALVRNEQRRPEQHVAVWFDDEAGVPPGRDG
jgi:YihY family inner membrane protein